MNLEHARLPLLEAWLIIKGSSSVPDAKSTNSCVIVLGCKLDIVLFIIVDQFAVDYAAYLAVGFVAVDTVLASEW